MFRDGRRAPASAREAAEARRRAPFWAAVSRLLSAPEGLLFNFRSRYSLRYRTRARIQPWEGGTSPIRAARSSSATAPARARGPPGCHRVSPALPDRSPPPPCTPATARARLLPFRSPLLREPPLLSPPGLTDMLKFGPSPRPAQGGPLVSPGAARRPAVPTLRRCTARGVAPSHSKSDDSHRAEARRHQSRSVLRSSSTPEPSGPLLPVDRCPGCQFALCDTRRDANDPAAGSPTAALLRLLLPPDRQARGASRHAGRGSPDSSPVRPSR